MLENRSPLQRPAAPTRRAEDRLGASLEDLLAVLRRATAAEGTLTPEQCVAVALQLRQARQRVGAVLNSIAETAALTG